MFFQAANAGLDSWKKMLHNVPMSIRQRPTSRLLPGDHFRQPLEWKNMNLALPGGPNGMLSQHIAHVLNQEVIGRRDDLLDLHRRNGSEAPMPCMYRPSEEVVGPGRSFFAARPGSLRDSGPGAPP